MKHKNKIIAAISTGVVLLFSIIMASCCIDRISVGHIGVKVKLAGNERGVQDMQLKSGWVVFNPLTEQIVEFPTSVQNIILSRDPHEGSVAKDKLTNTHNIDESITFSSIEGVNANADIGFSFHIDPGQAPHLYARFKQNDMRELAYSYMRNVLRESFSEVASKMPIQEIYGAGKTKMITEVTHKASESLGRDGIIIDQLTINGALRLPENVAVAINNAMAATQNAIQSENKVRQIKAEALQAEETARGIAQATVLKAQAEADALTISTKAEAEARVIKAESERIANEKLNSSLSSRVIHYKAITAWDGKLPTYVGSSGPLPMIDIK